jgi:hypothetical protein
MFSVTPLCYLFVLSFRLLNAKLFHFTKQVGKPALKLIHQIVYFKLSTSASPLTQLSLGLKEFQNSFIEPSLSSVSACTLSSGLSNLLLFQKLILSQ